jgi:hypothetical protein
MAFEGKACLRPHHKLRHCVVMCTGNTYCTKSQIFVELGTCVPFQATPSYAQFHVVNIPAMFEIETLNGHGGSVN